MTIDPKSFDLARHFLNDSEEPASEAAAVSLAEAIQKAIEDWFFGHTEAPDEPEPAPTQAERDEWKQMEMDRESLAARRTLLEGLPPDSPQEPEP